MKVNAFMKNYRNTVKSLDSLREKLDSLERRGNCHNLDYVGKNEKGKYQSPYDDIKLPSREFVAVMLIEHPYFGPREAADMIRHRMEMRHFFPDKYKTPALARGDIYYPDEMEEYREDMLDAIELERLRLQRATRHKIGIITITGGDMEKNILHYEGTSDCDNCDLEPPLFTTAEEHRAVCMREKDI